VDKFPTTQPEDEGRESHEDSGNAESPVWPVPLEEPGREQRRDKSTEIDGPVKPIENAGKKGAIEDSELVADMGRDTGFDTARADRDEPQTDHEPSSCLTGQSHQGKRAVPEAVDHRERHDDAIFSKKKIREESTEERGEVDQRDKMVESFGRFSIAHLIPGGTPHEPEVVHHENREDRPHAIETEAFGRFVSDDIGNARRHSRRLKSGRGVRGAFAHDRKGQSGWRKSES